MKKNPSHKDNLVALRRIDGQVRGVQRMIEDRKYCIDILTQIHAIKGALSRVEEKILEKHFQHCVSEAISGTCRKLFDYIYSQPLTRSDDPVSVQIARILRNAAETVRQSTFPNGEDTIPSLWGGLQFYAAM